MFSSLPLPVLQGLMSTVPSDMWVRIHGALGCVRVTSEVGGAPCWNLWTDSYWDTNKGSPVWQLRAGAVNRDKGKSQLSQVLLVAIFWSALVHTLALKLSCLELLSQTVQELGSCAVRWSCWWSILLIGSRTSGSRIWTSLEKLQNASSNAQRGLLLQYHGREPGHRHSLCTQWRLAAELSW